jgi:hypothetical protein
MRMQLGGVAGALVRTNGDGPQHSCQVRHVLVQHGQVPGQRRPGQNVARCGSVLLVQVAQLRRGGAVEGETLSQRG